MQLGRRRAVSELLATLMMIALTLSLGGYTTYMAINQYNLVQNAASLAALVQQQSAGKLISFVYSSVTPSGICPVYGGGNEGTTFTLALYNYGTVAFSTSEVFVNSSLISGWAGSPTNNIAANSMTTLTMTLPSCSHPSGQTVLLVDQYGDETQIGT